MLPTQLSSALTTINTGLKQFGMNKDEVNAYTNKLRHVLESSRLDYTGSGQAPELIRVIERQHVGAAPAGAFFVEHQKKAHDTVIQMTFQLAQVLSGFVDTLDDVAVKGEQTDDQVEQDLVALQAAASSAGNQNTDFGNQKPGASAPTDQGDEG